MFSKMKIALSAALVLGTVSAALASNENDQSVSEAQAAREAKGPQLPWWWNAPAVGRAASVNGGSAFGYVAVPTQQEGLSRKKSHKN